MNKTGWLWRLGRLARLAMGLVLTATPVWAAMGVTQLPAQRGAPEVTVFYPAAGQNQTLERAGLRVAALPDAPILAGNGRLIVFSHGSGSTPWAYADLAQQLVAAGFVVAAPTHPNDHRGNNDQAGPESWKTRPAEVSQAIDLLARTPRFAKQLRLDRVGMYGLSAGGHTALTLAGGRWSPSRLVAHCRQHIEIDFNACAGLVFAKTGSWLDQIKIVIVHGVLRWRFNDPQYYSHHDPRIGAIVAGMPYAADFDLSSLHTPRVPLALITARGDVWLHPQFHSDPLLKVCRSCTRLHDFQHGGHGAMLSPSRPYRPGLLADLLGDPPQFDRRETALAHQKVVQYFQQQLLN